MESAKMKHIDVAHWRLQDEVKSNRLRVPAVSRAKTILRTSGRRHSATASSESMRHPWGTYDAQENLKPGDAMGLWGWQIRAKQIRVVQISRQCHWNQPVAMPDRSSNSRGSEGSQVSPRATRRTRSQTPRHLVVRFHTSGMSWTVTVLHTSIS